MSENRITADEFCAAATAIEQQVNRVIVGQQQLVRQTLVTLLAGGNALLEGVPGLGKTMLVRTLADAVDCAFSRIQFTPDLMPADIVGTNLIVEDEDGRRQFQFEPGPIFANLVLADEINRATPKTQSAMLEAMQERSVTVAKATRRLPRPFFVLATQNPLEMEGTYPLPEAQLDRFFYKVDVPFPTVDELVEIAVRVEVQELDPVELDAVEPTDVAGRPGSVLPLPEAHHTAFVLRILTGEDDIGEPIAVQVAQADALAGAGILGHGDGRFVPPAGRILFEAHDGTAARGHDDVAHAIVVHIAGCEKHHLMFTQARGQKRPFA